MPSISRTPNPQEIEQQVEQIAAHILKHTVPARVAAIAAYGSCLISQTKPTRAVLVPFYYAFNAVPKNGYDGFVRRFNDDNDAIAAFDDQIAIRVRELMEVRS